MKYFPRPLYLKYFSKSFYVWSTFQKVFISEVLFKKILYVKYFSKGVYIWSTFQNVFLSEVLFYRSSYLKFFSKGIYIWSTFQKVFISEVLFERFLYLKHFSCAFDRTKTPFKTKAWIIYLLAIFSTIFFLNFFHSCTESFS